MNKVLSKLFIGLFLVGLVGLTSCGDDKDKHPSENCCCIYDTDPPEGVVDLFYNLCNKSI